MYYLAVVTDFIHALAMLLWIAGLPLLFYNKYKKLSLIYALYSILFIFINQVSHYTLNECIMTKISRYFWEASGVHPDTSEWFSVRFAKMIFGLTPSHFIIKRITEYLIGLSAIGAIIMSVRKLNYNVREQKI